MAQVTAEAAFNAARRRMAGAFAYPDRDCAGPACAAFADLWGRDPMAGLRGAYAGPISAARIIRRAGGWAALAASVGLVRADGPGVLGVTPRGVLMLGLGGGWWAGKARDGVAVIRADLEGWAWQ
jgi:hypothetical protein